MATRNDATGDVIATGASGNAYRDNWDAIFGKKAAQPKTLPVEKEEVPAPVEMTAVYYLIIDDGDGSSHVSFYRDYDNAAARLDDDECYANEGDVGCFQIPAGPNTISFCD